MRMSVGDYTRIHSYVDTQFLEYINELDLDEDRGVNPLDFADEFVRLMNASFPWLDKEIMHKVAEEHAELYNNQGEK